MTPSSVQLSPVRNHTFPTKDFAPTFTLTQTGANIPATARADSLLPADVREASWKTFAFVLLLFRRLARAYA